MAQLYIQKNAQPDTWVMSGAPTATTVFLSLAATINYSDGTSDSLPANTLAVLPDTTTVFDRTHDVYVCYTVQASGVLSVIKESLLPTLTSAYAPLCRIELHGIRPYQPEPYLAGGGAGALATTSASVVSAVGQGKVLDLAGGSAPSGWYTTTYDDSAWATPVAGDSSSPVVPAGSAWVGYTSGPTPDDRIWLFRQSFSLPAGTISSATLQVTADNYILDVYLNGTRLYGPGYGVDLYGTLQTVSGAAGVLVPGPGNVLAIRVQNENLHGANQGSSVAFGLSVGGLTGDAIPDPGGAEGSLLYRHSGAWATLPIGATGQGLTVVSGDPAWATPAASGVTSVAFTGPTGTTVSGSPITSSGTIALSWASQSANTVLGAPNGSSGAPTFRALVAADIPNLPASQITSGQLAAARGGTGLDGSGATNGQLLIGNGSGYTLATLTAGSGVTVTNSGGGISIAATGSGGTVTSVALTMPGIFSVSGSPVTGSGTLAVTLATETANTVLAGPASGSAAAPTFRAVQPADLPTAPTAGGHIHAHGHFL